MIVNPANRSARVDEYYFSTKLGQLRRLEKSGIDIINLGIGNPDLNPPETVTERLSQSAVGNSVHGYQSYKGVPELRSAFSDWYRRIFEVELNPESEILPLMGSKEGIMHISMAFLNSGDGVLIPDPGYPAYNAVAKLCNARSIFYDLSDSNGWFPDLERIESNGLAGVKMMWVNYPHMPSGVVATKEQFDSLVEFGIRNSILIVNDNPYSLVLNPKPISIFSANRAKEIALELNSLSKSHNMAGWRVGVVSGAEEYIGSVLKIVSNINSGMFLPVQQAAIEALRIDKVWYSELNNHYDRRRKLVYSMAMALGCSFSENQSGLFVWARIPDKEENSFEYSDSILSKYGVFITPGSVFGSNGHRYLRFSLCVSEERLEESRSRIENSNRF